MILTISFIKIKLLIRTKIAIKVINPGATSALASIIETEAKRSIMPNS